MGQKCKHKFKKVLSVVILQSVKMCGSRRCTPAPCGSPTRCLKTHTRTPTALSLRRWPSRWRHRWDCCSGLRIAALLSSKRYLHSCSVTLVSFSSKSSIPKVHSWPNTTSVLQFRLSGKSATSELRSVIILKLRLKDCETNRFESKWIWMILEG